MVVQLERYLERERRRERPIWGERNEEGERENITSLAEGLGFWSSEMGVEVVEALVG